MVRPVHQRGRRGARAARDVRGAGRGFPRCAGQRRARAAPTAASWRSGSAATRRCSTNTRRRSTRWATRRAYIGPIGAGTIAKLVHNCAGAAINTVLAEVFTMGVKAGVEPLALWEAIRQGAGGRQRGFRPDAAAVPAPAATIRPTSRCGCCTRTCRWRCQLAREVSVPMRLTNLARAGTDRGDEPRLGSSATAASVHAAAAGARGHRAAGGAGGADPGSDRSRQGLATARPRRWQRSRLPRGDPLSRPSSC